MRDLRRDFNELGQSFSGLAGRIGVLGMVASVLLSCVLGLVVAIVVSEVRAGGFAVVDTVLPGQESAPIPGPSRLPVILGIGTGVSVFLSMIAVLDRR